MSAREALIEQVKLVEDNYGPTEGFNPETLVDDYAHELAEKQRALDVAKLTKLTPEERRLVKLGIDLAADKIDREVLNSGS